jgi:hypothetical protein
MKKEIGFLTVGLIVLVLALTTQMDLSASSTEQEECCECLTEGGKLECGKEATIYENYTNCNVFITIQVHDYCEAATQTTTLYVLLGLNGEVLETAHVAMLCVTQTFTFQVPAGGYIMLNCRGENGYCTYKILNAEVLQCCCCSCIRIDPPVNSEEDRFDIPEK